MLANARVAGACHQPHFDVSDLALLSLAFSPWIIDFDETCFPLQKSFPFWADCCDHVSRLFLRMQHLISWTISAVRRKPVLRRLPCDRPSMEYFPPELICIVLNTRGSEEHWRCSRHGIENRDHYLASPLTQCMRTESACLLLLQVH